MVYTTYYNIKTGNIIGYETQLGRVIRIIWGVFGFSWLAIIAISLISDLNPVPRYFIPFRDYPNDIRNNKIQ